MSTQSNPIAESFSSPVAAPASATRPFFWSLRRELWEYRFIYLAPLGVTGVFLIGFLINITLSGKLRGFAIGTHEFDLVATPYDIVAGLMMLTTMVVNVFYCADALYGERRDRSILFWKSMPVSDLTTVLAKASIPLAVVPLVAWATAVAAQWIMLLVSSVAVLANGGSLSALWMGAPLIRVSLLLLYHLLTSHTLWPAPVFCWVLLVSSWARRAPLLWAALPVVAIGGLEAVMFRSWHFVALVGSRLVGAAPETASTPPNIFPTNPMTHITPDRFLANPSVWIGLALCAIFLALAVRMRHTREPI
ncbi:MAG: ABC transporter permease [Candidatus Sulfotelmatobacter sp.]